MSLLLASQPFDPPFPKSKQKDPTVYVNRRGSHDGKTEKHHKNPAPVDIANIR